MTNGDFLRRMHLEDAFSAAVAKSDMAMIVSDANDPDLPIVYVNSAFEKLSGFTRDELLGRNCRLLQGPATDPVDVGRIRQAIARKEPVHIEILNYRKDGSEFWNSLFISPVYDDAGQISHFFASQIDVTSRRQAQVDLRFVNIALAEAKSLLERQADERALQLVQLLQQRTDLVQELDHRVKNNLQMIASLISIEARQTDSDDCRRVLDSVRRRVDAISLAYKKVYNIETAGHFNATDFLNDLVQHIVSSAKRDDIEVSIKPEPFELPVGKATPLAVLLDEIIRSTIVNAYCNRGGVLRLEVAAGDRGALKFVIADGHFSQHEKHAMRVGVDETIAATLARQLNAELDWHPAESSKLLSVTVMPKPEDHAAYA